MGRFSLFVHDELTAELIKMNAGDPEKLDQVQKISRPQYEVLNEMRSPRFIKTHLPFSLLPPNLLDVGCKVSLQICSGYRALDSNNKCI
jgi:uncharacterized protein YcbK (DUF882 family)